MGGGGGVQRRKLTREEAFKVQTGILVQVRKSFEFSFYFCLHSVVSGSGCFVVSEELLIGKTKGFKCEGKEDFGIS